MAETYADWDTDTLTMMGSNPLVDPSARSAMQREIGRRQPILADLQERKYCNCPHCGYSTEPVLHKTERKHFDAHALECSRCLYRTETKATAQEALVFWNRRRAVRTAMETKG